MNTFYYSINEDTDQCFKVVSHWESIENAGAYLAEEAAEDYHDNHDGWEATWPLIINLHETENGQIIKSFDVDRETVPQFSSSEIVKLRC